MVKLIFEIIILICKEKTLKKGYWEETSRLQNPKISQPENSKGNSNQVF